MLALQTDKQHTRHRPEAVLAKRCVRATIVFCYLRYCGIAKHRLLCTYNALLLSIIQDLSEISFSELTQLVAGFLLDSNPPHEDVRINVNQQTQVM